MRESKKGYYIRTRDGHIGKIMSIDNEINKVFYCIKNIGYRADFQAIVKCVESEKQIIDLIEEDDLVKIEYYSPRYKERITRLFVVEYKDKDWIRFNNSHCELCIFHHQWGGRDIELKPIIKSIVTKEQFESMEYRIGE